MESTQQPIGNQIAEVRKIAHSRLARFSNLDPLECKESYLFRQDFFCGIKISLGPFRGVWHLEESVVQFFRNQTPLGEFALSGDQQRRAA